MIKKCLVINCTDLPFNRPNPFVVVSTKTEKSPKFHILGNTEFITNERNPRFVEDIDFDFSEDEEICFRLELFSHKCDSNELEKQVFVGYNEIALSDLLSAPVTRPLLRPKSDKLVQDKKGNTSTLKLCVEDIKESTFLYTFQFRGIKLRKGCFNLNPFYHILREIDGKWSVVHKSEVAHKTSNPFFKPVTMKSSLLCDNDPNKKLQIKCYNHSKIFKNDLIGVCYFEVKDLKLSASLHLLKEKHEHKNENSKNGDSRDNVEKVDNTENGYKHKNDDKHENGPEKWPKRGILEVTNFKSSRLYTFENYCENGLCFNSALAIDFSLNNGPFDNPQSLHFAGGYNEYESALYSLSTALSKFSTERRFSFWGLGGVIGGMESQCFSLTFDPQKPFVESTEEAIEFYNSAVKRRQVGQCGRKIIGEVLNTIKMVSDRQVRAGKACYDILFLMFSNGSFVDRSNLANLLVEISVKPISFVFIGMGPGDFEEYKFLNKLKLKSSSGKKSFRDNASFFNFRDIVEGHTPDKTRTVLFSHIDRRIRQQVLEYFHNKKLSPENIFEGTESDRYQDNFNFNHVQ